MTGDPSSARRAAQVQERIFAALNRLAAALPSPSTKPLPLPPPEPRGLLRRFIDRTLAQTPPPGPVEPQSLDAPTILDELRALIQEWMDLQPPTLGGRPLGRGYGFTGVPEEDRLDELDDQSIRRWENAGVPDIGRYSHSAEIHADDIGAEVSLHFPLHWRHWDIGWRYMFNLAVLGQIMECRPGDLVLDYAAGPCWVAEFLNRLGLRTVSVDLSEEMLRHGRERLRCDRRLNTSGRSHYAVADTQRLPFADGTFDYVLCMNALHHMPSFLDALLEIHRVLKDGGRAAFSEPGAAHACYPLTQSKMKELGVLEKSTPLPLIHLLARKAGFNCMRVVPLVHPFRYKFDYAAGPDDWRALQQMWDLALISHVEHSCFILDKGGQRPVNTRMPAPVLYSHLLRADIRPEATVARVPSGCVMQDRVTIRNTGDIVWISQGGPFGGNVCAGVKIYSENGDIIREDLARQPIPRDVAPGEAISMDLRIPASVPPGRYRLHYDMVVEHLAWFEHHGSMPFDRMVEVTPLTADLHISGLARRVTRGEITSAVVTLRNTGTVTWPSRRESFGGPVTIGVKVYTSDGRYVRDDLGRTLIGRDVHPGEELWVDLHFPADLDPGRYRLALDLVIEGSSWLEESGSKPVSLEIEVIDQPK